MKKKNKNKIFRSFHSPKTAAGRWSARGKVYSCFGCLLIIILSPITANAQFTLPTNQLPSLNLKPTITMTADPQTPLPNSAVIITSGLSGVANAGDSVFTWFVNGVKQKEASGVNKNTFALPTESVGSVYRVAVSVAPPGGDNLSDAISFTVGDFDLTWSASSQAPASYKGKLLPTQNSTLNISALPFVYRPGTKTLVAGNNLIYNWRVDDKFLAGSSGIGKSDLVFIANDYAGAGKSIRLEIKTSDGAVSISKSIEIPIARPQVFVRLADSETGFPYGAALKNLTASPISLNFAAQNYFFNATPDNLKWQWLIGGKEVGGVNAKSWFASLNLANAGLLFTQIQVIVKNSANELETAQSTINLEVK